MSDTITAPPGAPPAADPPPGRPTRRRTAEAPFARWLLVAPAVLLMAVIFIGSLVQLGDLALRPYANGTIGTGVTFDNIRRFGADAYSWQVLLDTVVLGVVCAVITVVIAYPMALALGRMTSRWGRSIAITLIFAPLFTSVVVRAYGWNVLLGDGGVINRLLLSLDLVDRPLRIMYEYQAVVIAMVHVMLPFAIFPLMGVIQHVHRDVLEAAEDLGASRWYTFRRVILPLTSHGVVLTLQLCFALTISAFATPALLGGGRVQVLSGLVYTNVGAVDWPMAAVQSFVLLLVALVMVALVNVLTRRRRAMA
ncbi:ABC transporter permease subunit [Nakamurella sp. YIM 132087]|uniref:ABC transporter permease subunit n=1 Tax=Nakamurella alba TaxID=2665158 RepID=A0A7K1FQZ4_9ACTN|nr:ABC transporter permease [Nakamurella alba]MTD15214.1 ABC transporter permease subunit [Nakamurella alba]